MGLLKKKKKEVAPPLPVVEMDVAMHNVTDLKADEKGEFCFGLFQTEALSPAEWQTLAQKARDGATFRLHVLPADGEDKDDD